MHADSSDKQSPDSPAGVRTVDAQEHGVILASGSPRRKLLLPIVRAVHSTVSPDVDEKPIPGESSDALARRLARVKLEVAHQIVGDINPPIPLISADTVVSLDEQPLGKPADEAEAFAMLQALSGRSHTVITAVGLSRSSTEPIASISVATKVDMRTLDDTEIKKYLERGEPFDKAGGYAIQDADLRPVRAINGCFPNVVGLPLCAVKWLLDGGDIPLAVAAPCQLCNQASELLRQHGFWAEVPPLEI
jgi:septum formation protein